MLKITGKLVNKLLMLAICTSLVSITMAFLGGMNVAYASASTVIDESDFKFDTRIGTIIKYTGADTSVVIPKTIGGVKVKSIGDIAFKSSRIASDGSKKSATCVITVTK